jgi:TonB-linked SusC/RagA family outer membrane protein
MKLSIFLLLIGSIQMMAAPGYSQNTRLSIKMEDAAVKEVLDEIESNSEFYFLYSSKMIDVNRKVDINARNDKIDRILASLFHGEDVRHYIIDRQIILSPINFINKKVIKKLQKQQQFEVTGTVTDAQTGEPLPGVNIQVKGTTIGTITNSEGNYSIDVPEEANTLIFSFVGKITVEKTVGDKKVINVAMQPDEMGLEEVVVVGYGTQKRRNITGSQASVSSEEIAETATEELTQSLQGKVSGVQVAGGGGAPGAQTRVLVRGVSSISSGSEPLFVVDGMPVSGGHQSFSRAQIKTSPLAHLDPGDIANIQVLKGPAATAIYGSRGANGVILIQTKTGKKGAGEVNVNYKTGMSKPSSMYDLVKTDKWLEIYDLSRNNSPEDLGPYDPIQAGYFSNQTLTRSEIEGNYVNWLDVVLQQGSFNELNLSASGGGENATYYLSGNYRNEVGVLTGNTWDRITGRTNVDFQPIKSLQTGVRLNLTYMKKNSIPIGQGAPAGNEMTANGHFRQAVFENAPWLPIYNEDGTFFDILSGHNAKATLYDMYWKDWTRQYRTLGKIFTDYTLPFSKNLKIHSEFSWDIIKSSNLRYGAKELRPDDVSYGFDEEKTYKDYNYNVYATYQHTFGESHNLNFVLGTESFFETQRYQNIEAFATTSDDGEIGAPAGDDVQRVHYGVGNETRFRGYFSRINYNYNEKYYLKASFRRDGSSKFGKEKRFGLFPAASAGWVITDESFMERLPTLNYLKLHASYGITGNSQIPQGITVNDFGAWKRYGNVAQGFYMGNLGNQEVTWETTNSLDIGFDYGLLKNRINGSFAFYNKDITDMLLRVPISSSNGIGSIWANIGDIRNSGIEFNINSVNIDTRDFTWRTGFNIAFNNNEVLDLTPNIAKNRSGIDQGFTRTIIGGKIGTYYMAKSAGINEETGYEMIYAVDHDKWLTNEEGEYVNKQGKVITEEENRMDNPHYLKTFKDSIIPATESNVNNNRYLFRDKTGLPTYYGGLTNTFSYKGFVLTAVFNFQGGNYISDNAWKSLNSMGGNFENNYIGNYWTPNNRDAKYPKPSWNNVYQVNGEPVTFSKNTDKWLYPGDYIRLGTIKLAYNLHENLLNTLKLERLQIHFSAHNFWTYSPHYPGKIPEITNFGGAQSRNLTPSIVGWTNLPAMERLNIGVKITF